MHRRGAEGVCRSPLHSRACCAAKSPHASRATRRGLHAQQEKADQLGALAKMEKDAMAAATYDEKHLLIDG